jgi:predicted PhzF superfamily epimerase YddE/YHI9
VCGCGVESRGEGEGEEAAHYELRWMTPTVEVELCGHATLAAAHALFESKRVEPSRPIVFHTRKASLLTVRKDQGARTRTRTRNTDTHTHTHCLTCINVRMAADGLPCRVACGG